MQEAATATLPFLQTLADHRVGVLTWILNRLTWLGDEKLFVVIALIVVWCFSKRGGQYLLTTGFSVSGLGQTLKAIFRVPRPWNLGDGSFTGTDPMAKGSTANGTIADGGLSGKIAKLVGGGADGWSFPSGHTLISVGTYGGLALWFKSRWVRIIGIALAVLIPFSRMYLGVHTPLDILLGATLALAIALALRPVFARGSRTAVRSVLIGNVALNAALLALMYLIRPAGLEGEDIGNYASGIKNLRQLIGAAAAVAIAFEADERWLHYSTKAVWWAQLLKIAGGSLILLALQMGIQKVFGYTSDGLTLENMTRMGIISCAANLVALTGAMAVWPMTFKWFGSLGKTAASQKA